jgi:hypothetical protein
MKRMLFVTALVSMLFAVGALAAPAGKGPAEGVRGPGAGKSEVDSRARETAMDEAKRREEVMKGAPEAGERAMTREEALQRAQEMRQAEGSETAAEMQARREERKQIQEQHREARSAGEAEAAGKKPWWKFWD